jgi:hypothetical protein
LTGAVASGAAHTADHRHEIAMSPDEFGGIGPSESV